MLSIIVRRNDNQANKNNKTLENRVSENLQL